MFERVLEFLQCCTVSSVERFKMQNEWFYKMYGLLVKSAYHFPESVSVDSMKFDVEISLGTIPESTKSKVDESGIVHLDEQRCLIKINGVAFFLVQNGDRIVVDELGGKDTETKASVRLYLLGPILNLLLNQRSTLLFHSCCIGYRGKCFIVAAECGTGKSTLAATFIKRDGLCLLSDDVSLVFFSSEGKPFVQPSLPRIKLLPDALECLKISSGGLERLPVENDKYSFLTHSEYHCMPMELKNIFILEDAAADDSMKIRLLNGKVKLSKILKHSYWNDDRFSIGHRDVDFIQAAKVARQCKTFLVSFSKQKHSPDYIVEHIINLLSNQLFK